MKKILLIILSLMLSGCLNSLPKPQIESGIRGKQFGIDANINESTIDEYLNRSDTVYFDMRDLKDEANFEAIGGSSYLDGYIKGFDIVPYPKLVYGKSLPSEVGNPFVKYTLFTFKDGEYIPNFKESIDIINSIFPKDKNIFLMCGGGGYASFTKELLINLGYDPYKIYNVGGYWFYEGKNSISTIVNEQHDFSNVPYTNISFEDLTPINGYTGNKEINVSEREEKSEIKELYTVEDLNKKEDFVLFVYLKNCSSCASFKPVVEELANSKQIPVYSINLELLGQNIEGLKYTPSLVVYKDGVLLDYLDANSDDDLLYYKDLYNLTTYIKQYLDIEVISGTAINNVESCSDNACSF